MPHAVAEELWCWGRPCAEPGERGHGSAAPDHVAQRRKREVNLRGLFEPLPRRTRLLLPLRPGQVHQVELPHPDVTARAALRVRVVCGDEVARVTQQPLPGTHPWALSATSAEAASVRGPCGPALTHVLVRTLDGDREDRMGPRAALVHLGRTSGAVLGSHLREGRGAWDKIPRPFCYCNCKGQSNTLRDLSR